MTSVGDQSTVSVNTDQSEQDESRTDDFSKGSSTTLEDALMSWTKKKLQDYLKSMKLPIYGSKADLTTRVMSKIPIKKAVEITRKYKRSSEEEGETRGKITAGEIEKMEIVLKRKRVENKTSVPNKINVQENRRKNSTKDTDDTLMINDEGENYNSDNEGMDMEVEEGKVAEEVSVIKVTNTKESAQMGTENESVATTKVDNVKRTRIGLMLTLPSSKEPDKKLNLLLVKWFTKMKEMDKNFTVISWRKEDGPKYPIKCSKHIPDTISKMRVYFARIQARATGGRVYADVFIHHSIPLDDLRGDAEWFLKENMMAIYKKTLQVEATTQKGWLLYSTSTTDIEALTETIENEIGTPVALRWKYINSSKYIEDEEERKRWMALHIEVDAKDDKKANRGLKRLYGSQSTNFPLGIRMRLVSEFREVRGNIVMMGKHTRLRVRQASFLASIEGYPSDDIQMLDYEDEGITLRQLIMSIQSMNDKTPGNLFHSVGKDWRGRIILNFLRNKADEARMITDGLIPYLQNKHGESVNLFFDPEAVIEKEKWEWNEEHRTVINPLSKELDGLEAIDDDYDFTVAGNEEDVNLQNNNTTEEGEETRKQSAEELALARLNLVVTGNETDSVSTLGNPMTPSSLQKARLSTMIPIRNAPSGTSSITDSSVNSRMTAIEQRISSMEESITQSLQVSMERIIEKMNSSNTDAPPGGDIAGQENE